MGFFADFFSAFSRPFLGVLGLFKRLLEGLFKGQNQGFLRDFLRLFRGRNEGFLRVF